MRSRVTSISLTRVEGAPADGITERVSSWMQADAVLRRWSESVARDGGYDKCEFSIEWANGATYRGRYDLVNWRDVEPDMAKHVRELAYFYTGRQAPRHMSPAVYGAFLEMHQTKVITLQYEKLLDCNDLGFDCHPPIQGKEIEIESAGRWRYAIEREHQAKA